MNKYGCIIFGSNRYCRRSKGGFLTSGIPRAYEDLEGWTAFENFLDGINQPIDVSVHADAFLYGEGEALKATPEEVAYFKKRLEMRPDFLSARCINIGNFDFTFSWNPEHLYGMAML